MRRVVPVALVWILLLAVVCPAFCLAPATHSCCQHRDDSHHNSSEPCGSVMHGTIASPAAVVPLQVTAPLAVESISITWSVSSMLPVLARRIPFSPPKVLTVLRI